MTTSRFIEILPGNNKDVETEEELRLYYSGIVVECGQKKAGRYISREGDMDLYRPLKFGEVFLRE